MVWEEIEAEENLDGLSEEQQATFRERAVPVPGGILRDAVELTNDARRDIPSTIIATGFTAEDYQKYASEHPVPSFLAGIPELRNVTWIDLPTSHWPMWSKPADLAQIIGDVATRRRRRPMRASLLDDSFAHHIWATERLIDVCEALTPEQLRTPAPGTYGSIIETFTPPRQHRRLVPVLLPRLDRPHRRGGPDVTLDDLRAAITATGRPWMELLAGGPDGEADIGRARRGLGLPLAGRLPARAGRPPRHRPPQPGLHRAHELRAEPPEIDLWAYGEATGRTTVDRLTA